MVGYSVIYLMTAYLLGGCKTTNVLVEDISIKVPDSIPPILIAHCVPVGDTLLVFDENNLLLYFSLSKGVLLKSKDMKETIGEAEVRSVFFHSQDSIFIHIKDAVIITNINFEIQKTIPLNVEENIYQVSNINDDIPIHFSYNDKKIFLNCYSKFCAEDSVKCFDTKIECAIDDSGRINEFIPIQYPEKFIKGYYGLLGEIVSRVVNSNNEHVFSFGADERLFIVKDDKIHKVFAKSKHQNSEAFALDWSKFRDKDLQMEQMIQAPVYIRLLYDPFKKYYYRLFLKDLPIQNKDGLQNLWTDKYPILMIIDEKFDVIEEVVLPKHKHSFTWFVTKDYLYLLNAHYKNKLRRKKHVEFTRFKIS